MSINPCLISRVHLNELSSIPDGTTIDPTLVHLLGIIARAMCNPISIQFRTFCYASKHCNSSNLERQTLLTYLV